MDILANGILVCETMEAGRILQAQSLSARMINLATVKPLNEEPVRKNEREYGEIVFCAPLPGSAGRLTGKIFPFRSGCGRM